MPISILFAKLSAKNETKMYKTDSLFAILF